MGAICADSCPFGSNASATSVWAPPKIFLRARQPGASVSAAKAPPTTSLG